MQRITLITLLIVFNYCSYAQVPSYVPTTSLIAWYAFNGNASNSHLTGNNGVAYGGVSYGTDRLGAAGSAYTGDGTSGIDIQGNTFPVGNAIRSVSGWFKSVLPYPGGTMEIFAVGGNGVPGKRFGVYTDGNYIGFESGSTAARYAITIDSAWHHVVVTYPSIGAGTAVIKLYLDGAQVTTNILNPIPALNTDTGNIHYIGALQMPAYTGSWTNSWEGQLDDIGVWGRELTPCEVYELYTGSTDPSGDITGPGLVCVGTTITLDDTASAGVWSSGNTAIATVGALNGIVTGVAGGITAISYTLSSGCKAFTTVTVVSTPTGGSITGPSSVCTGTNITLADAVPGGTWSSTNTAVASIASTASGIVTGVDVGTAIISYIVTNSCGTAFTSKTITVNESPADITGSSFVCRGSSTTLINPTSGGTWSSGSTAIATVGPSTGIVTGNVTGITNIFYSLSSGCRATLSMSVITLPVVPAIVGPAGVCAASGITLTDVTTGGRWTSTNTAKAIVGSATGVVTGIASGTTVITYAVTNACGITIASKTITVNPLPVSSTIIGLASACTNANTTYSGSIAGGFWQSVNTSIGTIGSFTGDFHGLALGTDTIIYTVSNGCGSVSTSKTITTKPSPSPILGFPSVCPGSTTTLADTSTGGTWSSPGYAAVATVEPPTGTVTGVAAGSLIITYTMPNGCSALIPVIVNPLPYSGIVTGLSSVCSNARITLVDTLKGGVWATSAPSIASVDTIGIVKGISGGTATISYTITNPCGTATTIHPVLIFPLPNPGAIIGHSDICIATPDTLKDGITGGVWSSSNPAIVPVNTDGSIIGVAAGTAMISYTTTNFCGQSSATKVITVYLHPRVGPITGPSAVCENATITLRNSEPGGAWLSSNGLTAVVSAGVVTGVNAGTAIITYKNTNVCGSVAAIKAVTVNPLPHVGKIKGKDTVCTGTSITLIDTVAGGIWLASNGRVIVDPGTGVVTGVNSGTVIITYSLTNICETAIATRTITVDTIAMPGIITGPNFVCPGTSITLIDTVKGGVWNSANISIATVETDTGIVTGVSAGNVLISYAVTSYCGISYASKSVAVPALPDAIGKNINICLGTTKVLGDNLGGRWTSSNTSIATVETGSGKVTAVSVGAVILSYTMDLGCEGTTTVTVLPAPDGGTITGPGSACKDGVFTLHETVAGGRWNINNTGVAAIDSVSGIVHAQSLGTATITYTTPPNASGCRGFATYTVTISQLQALGFSNNIVAAKCYGANTGIAAITVAGGTGPFQYNWPTGDTTAAVTNLLAGDYQVVVTDLATQCANTDEFTIYQGIAIEIAPTIKDDICKAGYGSVSIEISGGVPPYRATWPNNVGGLQIANLVAGVYPVSVTDQNNCKQTFDITIGDGPCNDLVIHDVITPNGDGVNDVWVIEGLQYYPNSTVQVFDKWGDMLYEQKNYNNDWNGKRSDGSPLPDGTYIYLVKLNAPNAGGPKNNWSGTIMIKK